MPLYAHPKTYHSLSYSFFFVKYAYSLETVTYTHYRVCHFHITISCWTSLNTGTTVVQVVYFTSNTVVVLPVVLVLVLVPVESALRKVTKLIRSNCTKTRVQNCWSLHEELSPLKSVLTFA
jgi:hypothetical protein